MQGLQVAVRRNIASSETLVNGCVCKRKPLQLVWCSASILSNLVNVVRSCRPTPSEEASQRPTAPSEASPFTSTPEHSVRPVCDEQVETTHSPCTTFAYTAAGKIDAHFASWLPSTPRMHAHHCFVGHVQVDVQASNAHTETPNIVPAAPNRTPNTAAPRHAAFAYFMSAGFLTAPPRLPQTGTHRTDQGKKPYRAFQVGHYIMQ